MKTRDSGMPLETQWHSFFDPIAILTRLGVPDVRGTIVDVGCGYGTFTCAAARLSGQRVVALDIEQDLVDALDQRCRAEGLDRVEARQCDITSEDSGIATGEASMVLLFNLLHCEEPLSLLAEARRMLGPDGQVAVIHWRSDIPTPRGPDLAIRPRPEDCERWLHAAGFIISQSATLLPPYHFGLVGRKPPV